MKWFSVDQIKDILTALGMVPSSIGKVKKDFVTALVNKVCHDLTFEKRHEIIVAIAGEGTKKQDQPTELLQAVSCLDAKEQEEYEPLVKSCFKEIQRQEAEEIARMGPLKRQQAQNESEPDKKKLKTAEEGPKEPPVDPAASKPDPSASSETKPSVAKAMQEEVPLAQERAPAAERKQRPLGKYFQQNAFLLFIHGVRILIPVRIERLRVSENQTKVLGFLLRQSTKSTGIGGCFRLHWFDA